MKRRWQRLAERIDNASLRERALIFLALAVLLVTLMEAALLGPETSRERRLRQDISQRQTETRTIQEQLQKMALSRSSDPDRDKRARLETVKSEIAAVEGAIAEEQRKFTAPAEMRVVLEGLLDRNHGVRLVEFRTMPVVPISDVRGAAADKPAAAKPAARPAAGAERFVYRHEFELKVSGSYAELHKYLAELEKLPTRLHWGVAELDAAAYPKLTLRLTVHTLSLDKAWLSA